jgi:hypothetical protein
MSQSIPCPGTEAKTKKGNGPIVVLAVVLGTAGVFVWRGPQRSTSASESAAGE